MPRFKQVQKVNASLRLLTSGPASINFQGHLNASCNDPSRLLSGLLPNICSSSRTDTALRADPHVGLGGVGVPAKEAQPREGCRGGIHRLLAQQSYARARWRSGKCGERFWAARARSAAACQTRSPPAGANFQSFITFSRVEYLPGNFPLQQWCGRWQPKPRPEPHRAGKFQAFEI